MPAFLEKKLKAEYGQNSNVPFKVMNAIGAMRGSKETAKGKEMEKKHQFSHTHIDHLGDGTHVVSHHPAMKSSKSGAFSHAEPIKYSATNEDLADKLSDHGIGE